MQKPLLILCFLCSFYFSTIAQSYRGTFKLVKNDYEAKLQLSTNDNINYSGVIQGTLGSMQVAGLISNGILTGNIQSQQGNSYFSFIEQGNNYIMTVMNYNFYGKPLPSTAVNFHFIKLSVNSESVVSNPNRNIYFNGIKVEDEIVTQLENFYKVKVQNGRYWYDKLSGMWGMEGEKTYGVILPNLPLGGPIKENASNGNTGVFINGRNLPQEDLTILQTVTGYLPPDRYWIDAQGNAGKEGGPVLVNLKQMQNQQNGRNNNSTFYRNSYTGIGSGSSGDTFYVIGKDFSYIH